MDEVLRTLKVNAPHKRNGSPQFSDDGVDAHTIHHGRNKGNKIDSIAGAKIGEMLLQHVKYGAIEIVSVTPEEYNDATKLSAIVAEVSAGKAEIIRIETTAIAERNKPRTKRVELFLSGGSVPHLIVVYKIPKNIK